MGLKYQLITAPSKRKREGEGESLVFENWQIHYFSHCHDKIPDQNQVNMEEGLFWLKVWGYSRPWWGGPGSRSMRGWLPFHPR